MQMDKFDRRVRSVNCHDNELMLNSQCHINNENKQKICGHGDSNPSFKKRKEELIGHCAIHFATDGPMQIIDKIFPICNNS